MSTWRRIHENEEGLETLQTVMVIAVAAIIMTLLKNYWPSTKRWFKRSVQNVIGWSE